MIFIFLSIERVPSPPTYKEKEKEIICRISSVNADYISFNQPLNERPMNDLLTLTIYEDRFEDFSLFWTEMHVWMELLNLFKGENYQLLSA